MTAGALVGPRAGLARTADLISTRYLSLGEATRRVLVFSVAMGFLLVRRPDSITNPQFILEDGSVFYVETWFAHNPLALFFQPYAGYQSLAIRIAGVMERLVPVANAPLIDNLLGLGLVAALAAFLASDRLQTLVPDARWRLGLAAVVLVLPGVQEAFGTMVDVQRLAALFLIALYFARPAKGRFGTLADLALVAVTGLSGLTGVLLQPLFWWRAYRRRRPIDFAIVAVLAATTVVQLATILLDGRRPANLDEPLTLAAVFAIRLFLDWPLGMQVSGLLNVDTWPLVVATLLSVPMAVGFAWSLRRLPRSVAGPIVFIWLAMVISAFLAQGEGFAGLIYPQEAPRYFLLPGALMLLTILVWFVRSRPGRERTAAFLLVAVFTVGIGGDLRIPSYPDDHWATASQCLGGPDPCVVPVFFSPTWDINWPGINGQYVYPRPGA